MRTFDVFITAQHCAWNNKATKLRLNANTASEAITKAKQTVRNSGFYRHDTPLSFKATEVIAG